MSHVENPVRKLMMKNCKIIKSYAILNVISVKIKVLHLNVINAPSIQKSVQYYKYKTRLELV